ncbi:FirrV-1-A40 precursor [Feldmannia irregularis virus a]|uniref:FirrV-1-A40 n=1 Tax=Feldmannia irregularis virus a TaxID=231992 RepID=Q6XM47_9PHYC|nr:FirrV-1-A40 precursor [Feldmannia irregularis virus a]AAR26864.1 FirrV-1-A40 precursor [Feldmannia irregularis virus a]
MLSQSLARTVACSGTRSAVNHPRPSVSNAGSMDDHENECTTVRAVQCSRCGRFKHVSDECRYTHDVNGIEIGNWRPARSNSMSSTSSASSSSSSGSGSSSSSSPGPSPGLPWGYCPFEGAPDPLDFSKELVGF